MVRPYLSISQFFVIFFFFDKYNQAFFSHIPKRPVEVTPGVTTTGVPLTTLADKISSAKVVTPTKVVTVSKTVTETTTKKSIGTQVVETTKGKLPDFVGRF